MAQVLKVQAAPIQVKVSLSNPTSYGEIVQFPQAYPLVPKKKNSMNPSELSRSTYESVDIVELYAKQDALQPPEQTILNLLRSRLHQMSMLDIGVGGGRTTQHFAPFTKEYVGVDYASNMIQICRKKFPHLYFDVADARNLSAFKNGRFDFTLFSFNGLDYVNHEDRGRALSEMHRVTKECGYVCMSTHNLNYVPELLKLRFKKNPIGLARELRRIYRIYSVNKHLKENAKREAYLLLNDGALGFRLITHYIKPEEHVKHLTNLGFGNIRTFSLEGKEIIPANLTGAKDPYLYFLCTP